MGPGSKFGPSWPRANAARHAFAGVARIAAVWPARHRKRGVAGWAASAGAVDRARRRAYPGRVRVLRSTRQTGGFPEIASFPAQKRHRQRAEDLEFVGPINAHRLEKFTRLLGDKGAHDKDPKGL